MYKYYTIMVSRCLHCGKYNSSKKYRTCYACYRGNPNFNKTNSIFDKYCKTINCEVSILNKYEYCFNCFQKSQKLNDNICFMKLI